MGTKKVDASLSITGALSGVTTLGASGLATVGSLSAGVGGFSGLLSANAGLAVTGAATVSTTLGVTGTLTGAAATFSGLLSATSHIFNGVGTHTTGNTEMLADAAGGNLKIYAPTGKTMGLYFADVLGTSFSATGQTITGTAANDAPTFGANLLGAGGWTSTGWTGSAGGPYTHTTGNVTALSNTLAATVGVTYMQVVTITTRTAGSVTVTFGGNSSGALTATAAAIYFVPTTTAALTLTPTTDFDGTVAITLQAVTAAASPMLVFKDSTSATKFEMRYGGFGSTWIGHGAGVSNVNSGYNTACGYFSMNSNVTGSCNTAFGHQSLISNVAGINNVAVGFQSLFLNVNGSHNTANGYRALFNNIGTGNVATGWSSLSSNTTGTGNVANGYYSLYSNTTGFYNVANGHQSGYNSGTPLQTLTYCSFYGYGSNSTVDGITNSTAIGNAAQVTASNQIQLGNSSVTAVNTSGKIGNTNAANPVQFAIPTPVAVATVTATAIPGLTTTFRGTIEVYGSDGSYGRFALPIGSTTSTLVYGSATVSGGTPASTKWGIDYSSGWRYNNQTAGALTFTLIEVLTGIA